MNGKDPVGVERVAEAWWQAACDSCGWHTQPASPEGVVGTPPSSDVSAEGASVRRDCE